MIELRSIASMLTDFTPKHVPADRDYGFCSGERRTTADPIVESAERVDRSDRLRAARSRKPSTRDGKPARPKPRFCSRPRRSGLSASSRNSLRQPIALFMEQTGARMATQISEGLATMAAELSGSLAAVLTPLVEEQLREQAITAFVGEVERLTKGLEGTAVDVTGPSAPARYAAQTTGN